MIDDPYSAGTRLYPPIQEALAVTTSNNVSADAVDYDEVMLHAKGCDMKIARGSAPDAEASYDFVLDAGERFHCQVVAGSDKIAAVALSGSGTLYITPADTL